MVLALLAAVLAPRRLVRQPALAIESLLARGEDELLAAIHARDALSSALAMTAVNLRVVVNQGTKAPKHERPGRHACEATHAVQSDANT